MGDRLVVRQPPGEANALGRILFMFPNEHAVYLHDTPARGLFAASRRAFSHGCVRVEQPMRLAELVMGGASAGWTTGRLQSLLGRDGADGLPAPHDPDSSRIFHRIRRRIRRLAGSRRHIRNRAARRRHDCAGRVKIELSALKVYRGRVSFFRVLCFLRHTMTSRRAAPREPSRRGGGAFGVAARRGSEGDNSFGV